MAKHVRIDSTLLLPPKFFGHPLHEKILKKEPLNSCEYSKVFRELARVIEEHTIRPHPDCMNILIQRTLDAYPGLVINDQVLSLSAVSIMLKLPSHFLTQSKFLEDAVQ